MSKYCEGYYGWYAVEMWRIGDLRVNGKNQTWRLSKGVGREGLAGRGNSRRERRMRKVYEVEERRSNHPDLKRVG